MSSRVIPWITVALATVVLLLSCGSDADESIAVDVDEAVADAVGPDSWMVPVAVDNPTDPTRADWLAFGWDTFVALSWPAEPSGDPGEPDESASITSPTDPDAPVVWTTYLAKEQLLLPAGADPGTWADPTNTPATNQGLPVLDGFTKTNPDFKDEFEEAFSNAPLIDTNGNYVLYEIKVNQAEFNYFVANKYYDATNQEDSFKTDPISFVGFPDGSETIVDPVTKEPIPEYAQQGALEVKASWRILTAADDATRYYTRVSYYESPDGDPVGPVTLGLVGLHILRLTPNSHSTWFWATFEQIDNLDETGGSFFSSDLPAPGPDGFSYQPPKLVFSAPLPPDPTPVNVSRVYPIPTDVQSVNTQYQSALEGSVWQYYQLIDVQNPGPTNNPCQPPAASFPINNNACVNTDRLANVTMETYEQVANGAPQSCVHCHGRFAFPQGAPKTSEYQVFSFLLGNATPGES